MAKGRFGERTTGTANAARNGAIGLMLSCTLSLAPAVGVAQGASVEASRSLQGKWRVELQLDVTDAYHVPTAREASGEIAFDSTSWWGQDDRWGRHSVDLGPFFGRLFARPQGVASFGAADTSMITEVTGRVAGQTVEIDFMPRVGRLGVTMRGRYLGDSAVGEWYRRGMDGSGKFVMRRLSREPVKVAAINDPTLNPALRVAAAAATPARSGAAAARPAGRGAKPAVATSAPATPATRAPARLTQITSTGTLVPAATARPTAAVATTAPTPATTAALTSVPSPASPASAAPARSRTVDPKVTGGLRVRLFDRASRRWVATGYQLQLANDRWIWGDLKSGAGTDGWGPAAKQPAGSHRVVVENFVCGDKYWFFAQPIVRPVDIRPGETAEVTIELDLSAEPAKKTLDNPTGARCAAGPGNVR